MDLPEDQIELTRLAASLHDLGKLAIPEELLRKPGPLTEPERMILERHPQIGFRMLESLGVDTVADWVLHHHERWDGSGYPDGLPGDQIPLGARIIFVADAYDAMTSECVYRRRVSPQEAVEELERCAGTQFDPAIVSAFAEELALSATVALPAAALASCARRGGLCGEPAPKISESELSRFRHGCVTDTCVFPRYDRLGEEAGYA
jgi:HD-GYP domain-containing protein (c-di-GMP phosphodiesterase class II)